MSLTTHSRFYFDYDVDSTSLSLDFSEGGPEIQATVDVGSYTFTDLATKVAAAMNAVGGQTYTVTADRTTRKYTISAPGAFELLTNTGTRSGTGIWTKIGFSTVADKTGSTSYVGDTAAGQEYTTQFILQQYVPKEHFNQSASEVINKAADGTVEVVKFGSEQFIDMNFRWITDTTMPASAPIRNRATGVSDFLSLVNFLITKKPFEFMPDEDTQATYSKCILEKTPDSSNGTGYKLQELTKQGLPGFYESGLYRLRVLS